jgi:hypothetical protein
VDNPAHSHSLDYATAGVRSADPTLPEARLVSGTLALIVSLAAIALVGLGGVLRHDGGISRRFGNALMALSLVPAALGATFAWLSLWRNPHLRSLGIAGLFLSAVYCMAAALLLIK